MTAANVATHSVQVAWTGQLTGIFTLGRSTIGGTDVLAGGFGANVFDDITADHKSSHYERGRAGDGGNMQQGTYQVKLKDSAGRYNPENPDSPLAPYLVPMRPIRHTADGPMVGGTALAPTFARASAAYLSDGSLVATGLPRYETVGGRQGLMVEEGATNLITNGGFEAAGAGPPVFLGWSQSINDGAIADGTGAGEFHGGAHAAKLTAGPNRGTYIYRTTVTVPGNTYTRSFWTRGDGTSAGRYQVLNPSDWSTIIPLTSTGVSGINYQLVTYSFVAPVGCVQATMELFCPNTTGGIAYFDDAQTEAKPYPTTYTDTTRAAETATIPTAGVLSAAEGTVEMWFRLSALKDGQIVGLGGTRWVTGAEDAGTLAGIYMTSGGNAIYYTSNGAAAVDTTIPSALVVETWTHLAITWRAGGYARYYLAGAYLGQTVYVQLASLAHDLIYLGCTVTEKNVDGLISDLRISSRARTDAEIAAACAAGTLPVDADTTYKIPMDGTLVPQTWGNQGLFYGFISEISHDPDARESTISAVDLYEWLTMAKPVIATMTGARVDTIIAAILDAVEWTDPGMRLLDVSLDTVPSWSADGTKTALALIGELLSTDLGAFFIDGAGRARYINRRIRYGGTTMADTLTGSHISRIKASVSKDDISNSQTVTRTGGTPQTATDADSRRAYGSRVGSDITSDYLASDSHANSLAGFLVALHKDPRVPARSVGIINGDSTRLAKLLAREIGDLVAVTEARGGTDMVGRVQSLSMDISEGFTVQQGRYTVDRATLTPFVIGESVIGTGVLVY